MTNTILSDLTAAAAKTAPPIFAWAFTLDGVVALFGIGWIILQAAYLIAKWRRELSAK